PCARPWSLDLVRDSVDPGIQPGIAPLATPPLARAFTHLLVRDRRAGMSSENHPFRAIGDTRGVMERIGIEGDEGAGGPDDVDDLPDHASRIAVVHRLVTFVVHGQRTKLRLLENIPETLSGYRAASRNDAE